MKELNSEQEYTQEQLKKMADYYGLQLYRRENPNEMIFRINGLYQERELTIKAANLYLDTQNNIHWYVSIAWKCQNPHKLSLSLYKKGFLSSIGTWLGLQDIQLYDDAFDKTFMLKCNKRLFPLQHFDEEFRKELLTLAEEDLSTIKVKGDEVSYYEEGFFITMDHVRERLTRISDLCYKLAGKVDAFDLPKAE